MRSLKWVVAILLGINLGVWLYVTATGELGRDGGAEGRLPRVAPLELVTPEPVPDDVVVPEAPVAEVEAPQVVAESAEQDQEGEVVEVDNGPLSCFLVGWFEEESVARQALAQLRSADRSSFIGIRQREQALDDFYWVLVPPLEDRQAAIRVSRELSGRDIESYVIPSGDQENGISLGLFRSRTSAEQLLQQRTRQNVPATLVILPRNRISYALVFEGPPEAVELPEVAHGLAEDGGLERVEISDCEGVATTEKTP